MGLLLSLKLAWELGYLIALPAAGLGFLGAYADKYAGTSPLFIILGFLLAFTVSAIAVTRKVRAIVRAQYGDKSSPKKS